MTIRYSALILLKNIMLTLAINGFGRIGRVTLRTIIENYHNRVRVTAINTSGSMDTAGWAHFEIRHRLWSFWPSNKCFPPKMARKLAGL